MEQSERVWALLWITAAHFIIATTALTMQSLARGLDGSLDYLRLADFVEICSQSWMSVLKDFIML